jgi:hypothetical protein
MSSILKILFIFVVLIGFNMTTKENINVPEATAIPTLRVETDKPFAEGTPYFTKMKLIPLTQGKSAQVDDSHYAYLSQFKWHAEKIGNTYYALRWDGKLKRKVYMHRLIMNPLANLQVDHIDHNGLNCQYYNMRICTKKQNSYNQTGHSITGYKGVYILKGQIVAQIWYDKKNHYLGNFKTTEQAARVYDKVAKIIYGEFANLNFKD